MRRRRGTPATRELPEWGLRAEYWIEGDGDYDDTTESGSYLRLRTDQVRFYPIDAPHNWAHCDGGEYRMRLLDLFVGVASVGNDPTWHDGGPGGRFRECWSSYSFGELDHSAQTRRVVLARLIPRLVIADRCTLEGRFLHSGRRTPHIQNPPRLRQYPHDPERPLPVHCPEIRCGHPADRIPAVRGRPHADRHPEQSDDAQPERVVGVAGSLVDFAAPVPFGLRVAWANTAASEKVAVANQAVLEKVASMNRTPSENVALPASTG
ncbi:hypothetical protein ACIG56_33970 [Nocardia fusca]|uniref:hypothetical protein n=1 Tax=Nocardia fusca TaxID=941183 RepID=UPI0037C7B022